MSSAKHRRTKVFISYSHHDIDWLKRLRVHLKPLERDYSIEIWDDTQIKPSSRWKDEIVKTLESTRVAILLVSADFLASDFISRNELPPLLKAAEEEGALILPLILSPSRFLRTASLSKFQAVNDPFKPLIKLKKWEQEAVFDRVTEIIESAFTSLESSQNEIAAANPDLSLESPTLVIEFPPDLDIVSPVGLEISGGDINPLPQEPGNPSEYLVNTVEQTEHLYESSSGTELEVAQWHEAEDDSPCEPAGSDSEETASLYPDDELLDADFIEPQSQDSSVIQADLEPFPDDLPDDLPMDDVTETGTQPPGDTRQGRERFQVKAFARKVVQLPLFWLFFVGITSGGGFLLIMYLNPPPVRTPPPALPLITDIKSVSTSYGATISWITDKPAEGQLEYGVTSARPATQDQSEKDIPTEYSDTAALNSGLRTDHSITLDGLLPGTVYRYRISVKDDTGNAAKSDDLAFTTLQPNPADTTPPEIKAVKASAVTDTEATITWVASEIGTAQVEYGTTKQYMDKSAIAPLQLINNITLSELVENQLYHFRIVARDEAGNRMKSGDFIFKTKSGPVISEDRPRVPDEEVAVVLPDKNIQVNVISKRDWTSTGLTVNVGDEFIITSTGIVTLNPETNQTSGPAGINTDDSKKLMPDQPTGGLIGVIGADNDDFFFIGQSAKFVCSRAGLLFLSVNEGNLSDNTGVFSAEIQLWKKK